MRKILLLLVLTILTGCTGNSITTSGDYSSVDNKGYGWGIKKVQNQEPEVPDYIKTMLSENGGVYIGNPNEKKLYLTFDEGYENGYTEEILSTLK